MPRASARFRISIKDHKTGNLLKVELVEAAGPFGERRYKVRVNGRDATRHPQGNLTEILDRLRRWVVRQA